MIRKVKREELSECLEIIHNSFLTVAKEFQLTKENCPTHTAFLQLERLEREFAANCPMYVYEKDDQKIAFFSLYPMMQGRYELNHLAVLPEYRHKGIGREMVEYAKYLVKEKYKGRMITIGIVKENKRLKDWYVSLGFREKGTKKYPNLPFTVGFMELDCKK